MTMVEIADTGSVRKVRIRGEAYSYSGYWPNSVEFETPYSVTLLRKLERVKGASWLKDEIDRSECLEYVEMPLRRFIERFCPNPAGLTALDVGCGAGASSIVLARIGFRVIGVEPVAEFVEVGRLRIHEAGLASRAEQRWIDRAAERVPFEDESFDVVVLEAVIEHVAPGNRPGLLAECWRVLRRGGLLFIHDTPNRVWPLDGHTTGLWFTTWLPFRLAVAYARSFSRKISEDTSDEELISRGICAPTYWEFRRALPAAHCLNLSRGNDVSFAFGMSSSRRRSYPKAVLRAFVVNSLRAAGWAVQNLLRVPPVAILQNLDVCFQKP